MFRSWHEPSADQLLSQSGRSVNEEVCVVQKRRFSQDADIVHLRMAETMAYWDMCLCLEDALGLFLHDCLKLSACHFRQGTPFGTTPREDLPLPVLFSAM